MATIQDPKHVQLIVTAVTAQRKFWHDQSLVAHAAADAELLTLAESFMRDDDAILSALHNDR